MFSWLGLGAVNPWLLCGAIAVAAPIIIHLLSKRKFQLLEWAAMDFLLEADRRNRRRVRLENFLLLLLRCLAVLLVAMLAARPFFAPQGTGKAAMESATFERIILLDDSPSMKAAGDNKKEAFDAAKEGLVSFIEELVETNPGDRITLLVTSRPDQPIFNGKFLRSTGVGGASPGGAAAGGGAAGGSADEANEIVRTIKNLETSDRAADLDRALLAVDKMVGTDAVQAQVNRVVYVVTDLRRRDWVTVSTVDKGGTDKSATDKAIADKSTADKTAAAKTPTGGKDRGPVNIIKKLRDRTQGVVLVDVGSDATKNLSVADVQLHAEAGQAAQLVAGVPAQFEVVVRNTGSDAASGVEVEFSAGETGTQKKTTDPIPAGGEQKVVFDVTPPRPSDGAEPKSANLPIRVSIDQPDVLKQDNQRLYAGRVSPGVNVLIVDGDPTSDLPKTERYFLENALTMLGKETTEYRATWSSDAQFEDGMPLDKFQLIFLCNVYRLSQPQLESLEKWVKAGGGLVVALGDKIDTDFYNEKLYADGKGLVPIRLEGRRGDETQKEWANFRVETKDHPTVRVFDGPENGFVEMVKVFQWWRGRVAPEDVAAGRVTLAASFTDPDNSPAVVEKTVDKGRVIVLTTPLDKDWSNWPIDVMAASYVVTVQETAQYMARKTVQEGNFVVGQPIHRDLDPGEHKPEVTVAYRGAHPDDKPDVKTEQATLEESSKTLKFDYADTNRVGYYEVDLAKSEGEPDRLLYAANLDASEGDLRRIGQNELAGEFGDARVDFAHGRPTIGAGTDGAKTEYWFPILIGVMAVLGTEQFLAWLFGRKR